jgi:F-type H+-transporting ATPase subunit delta
MLSGALAKRYARALFDLTTQMKIADQVDTELTEFSSLLDSNREMRSVLNHPNVGLSKKKDIVSKVCSGYSKTTLNFIFLLIESRRQNLAGPVSREFSRMADEVRGVTEVLLTSAVPLTEQQDKELMKILETQTGGKIRLITTVDPELIGGAKLRIGDTVMDGTVRTALQSMHNDLRKVGVK